MARLRIALISNPKSTGNLAQLPRIRAFCAEHPDIFHYEVEQASQIGEAMRTIARIDPAVLAINGGDGTVQAVLTELHNGGHFGTAAPPVAVLPSGKTNLIALDLGVQGDPVDALEKLLAIARADMSPHLVARELISLSGGETGIKPVIGMFMGGAGLADIMLYCRERVYPLGLPNSISHFITAVAVVLAQVFRLRASFLPPEPMPLSISVRREGAITARFSFLFVTTLEKLLLSGDFSAHSRGPLKFVAVEQKPVSLLRAFFASMVGRLGRTKLDGVHVEEADEIAIEGESSRVILDGETFRAGVGKPILLRPAQPLSFVRIAA
ncbi:acylglycerol kinase family protein [Sphingomonas sp.]|uniref:diacylglycerol/lipid kinase family protein n=1 Tax=Sphingomonas sp. TaxID=28214 RepID=UPI0025EF33C2|nr:acylglycerol kinase family protein [Sphingomonas sp.]